jgi:diguanylate cyclase (GGDEF)-like protein
LKWAIACVSVCTVSVSRPTQQYPEVRIQEGLGWVDLSTARTVMPPGGKKPRAGKQGQNGFLFHVAEIPARIAVLSREKPRSAAPERDGGDSAELRAVDLLLDQVEQVTWVEAEAGGAAIAEAYSDEEPSALNAACAMAAVGAHAGEQSEAGAPLVFNVKGEQSNTVTVRLAREGDSYGVTAQTPRTGLDDLLKSVKQELRSGEGCSLILANLDHSMALNDRYGYRFGDLVLARVHRLFEIEEQAGAGEFYRLGGDEFSILIPGSNTKQTDALAERIRQGVVDMNVPLKLAGKKGKGVDCVTLSVGVVHVPPEAARSHKEVWQIAQYTIWKAKDAGRNAVKKAVAI